MEGVVTDSTAPAMEGVVTGSTAPASSSKRNRSDDEEGDVQRFKDLQNQVAAKGRLSDELKEQVSCFRPYVPPMTSDFACRISYESRLKSWNESPKRLKGCRSQRTRRSLPWKIISRKRVIARCVLCLTHPPAGLTK